MDLGLRDAVAVVAGSSGGIGRATAMGFAREGARVVINGRREEELAATAREIAEETGATVEAVCADVSTEAGCAQLVERAIERFGRLDALVTNAGGPPSKSFEAATDEDWLAAFNLTLLSAIRLMRLALPHLREMQGSVVNITSISVKQPVAGLVLSNGLRPGVVGIAKTVADEMGAHGVRVNEVAPGLIWTDRQVYLVGVRAEAEGVSVEEIAKRAEAGIPLRRFGTAEEVANLAVFLCSRAASYITGTTVLVDGGMYRGLM